jgi:hypothetical protein
MFPESILRHRALLAIGSAEELHYGNLLALLSYHSRRLLPHPKSFPLCSATPINYTEGEVPWEVHVVRGGST